MSLTLTKRGLRTSAAIAAVAGVAAAGALTASPATAADHGKARTATVSVLHAIPAGLGADKVDVYAGNALLIDNFTPGSLKTLRVPAGTYDLGVFADGQKPGANAAVLSAKGVKVPAGANATVTANLDAAGKPALNVFVNDTKPAKKGDGRLTVRHIAAAPAVDVRAGGKAIITDLVNPQSRSLDVPAGKYDADVVLAGTSTVAIGPATVQVKRGFNTIVYAWGSAADGTLKLAVQQVKTRK